MAWTDSCKMAFTNTAKHFWLQRGRKGITKIIKDLAKDTGIPFKTLEQWWYEEESRIRERLEASQNFLIFEGTRGRPTKLQQKRDKKKHEQKEDTSGSHRKKPPEHSTKGAKVARAAARAIEAGVMSVDDVREISESIGKAIKEHDLPDRAGTQVELGLKQRRRERARQSGFGKVTSKGNFERLWKHLMATAEGLTYFADKTIKPTSEDDLIAMKGILAALPDLVVQCIRLGVDVVGICETFTKGGRQSGQIQMDK